MEIGRPHFIGIGAHKAGTSWLHKNLRTHPGLWLPPTKELHVFDGLPNLSRMTQRLTDALDMQQRGDPAAETQPIDFLRKFVEGQPKDFAWYRSLFEEAGSRICGEITPAYSLLDIDTIKRVHGAYPQLRIVFILRNPMERVWSHLRSDSHKPGLDPAAMSFAQLRERIDSPVVELRTRYTRTLSNWERFYPTEQILFLFHDDIVENPDGLLNATCDFLGVEYLPAHFEMTRAQRVHGSIELPVRPEVKLYLARKYREEIAALQRRFGGHTDKWLADCEGIIHEAR